MILPTSRRAGQKAAYFAKLSGPLLAGSHPASQVDDMAGGLTRAAACNSIRYPSPSGWSVCVPYGSPVFLSRLARHVPPPAMSPRRELADPARRGVFGLCFPRWKALFSVQAVHSRGQDQCADPQSQFLPVLRRFRSRPAVTRWASRPSMARVPGLRPQPCLTATSSPARSSGRAQTCSTAARTRASAKLIFPARCDGSITETKPSAPLGLRWLFCCQMSAGMPVGQEPEGT